MEFQEHLEHLIILESQNIFTNLWEFLDDTGIFFRNPLGIPEFFPRWLECQKTFDMDDTGIPEKIQWLPEC